MYTNFDHLECMLASSETMEYCNSL